MKPIYFLFAGLFILGSCTSQANSGETTAQVAESSENGTDKAVKTINSLETKALLEQEKTIVILDVRTPEEFAGGHLKNARLLNKNAPEFESEIKALDKNKTYLVYCAIGGRSGQAAQMMNELGFTQVYDATEGFNALKAAGLKVEN